MQLAARPMMDDPTALNHTGIASRSERALGVLLDLRSADQKRRYARSKPRVAMKPIV